MVGSESGDFSTHDTKERNPSPVSDKLSEANRHSERIERNMQQAHQTATDIQSAVEQLFESVTKATNEVNKFIKFNASKIPRKHAENQQFTENDVQSISKSVTPKRQKTRESQLEL